MECFKHKGGEKCVWIFLNFLCLSLLKPLEVPAVYFLLEEILLLVNNSQLTTLEDQKPSSQLQNEATRKSSFIQVSHKVKPLCLSPDLVGGQFSLWGVTRFWKIYCQ